jgi:hypothetical protein
LFLIINCLFLFVCLMIFNATFNNISTISWRSVFLGGERGGPGKNPGRDRMVVGFTTTYAISAYHHWCCEFESRSDRGVQHYVIKFVSDFRQIVIFKNKEWYTKHYTKTQDWATLTPQKIEVNPGAAPEGQSSCSSSGIRLSKLV